MQASDPFDPRAVLGAVKAQPGNAGANRKPGATAGLARGRDVVHHLSDKSCLISTPHALH